MARKGTLEIKIVGDHGPLQQSVKGALGTLGGFAKKVGMIGAAAAGAIGVTSVKAFASFDSAMTESLAIMGDVSDTMRKDMSKAAREVGKTTQMSATEAAEAYFFLASAGMDAEQAIGALPQVAAFAQAGMFDMATATDLATDAQSALGMASDDAEENLRNLTRVTDVFVKANTLANTSVEQVAEAMTNKAGAAARAVGMEIEETTAVLAAFADQGVKGAEAGTQFSIVMRDLQTRALENAEAFKRAGVAVFDADGEMRNMADIVGELEGRLEGMSDAQVKAELSTMGFTDKSIAALQTLLGTSEAIREYEGELRDAAGTTQDVADKQMESFSAQMGLVWSQIQDVAISIGQALVPALQVFAGWLQDHLPTITSWFEAVSSKFENLFGTADESMSGTEDSLASAADAASGYDAMLGDALGSASQTLSGYDIHVADTLASTTANAQGEFGTMGDMMDKLGEVWADVFENDIKPWFNNTFIPWLTNEAAPAIGRAGAEMGRNLARAFIDAWADALAADSNRLLNALPSWMRRGANMVLASPAVPGYTGAAQPKASPAPRRQTIPTNLRAYHEGGQFRAPRPGGEGLALLKDREWVVPEGLMGGGRKYEQHFHFEGPVNSDAITGRAAALALRMA